MLLKLYSKKLCDLLKNKSYTLSVAESCTGGLLSATIIANKGASEIYDSGFIVYSNQAKESLLNVPKQILEKHGAVSKETAILLAENTKSIRKTTIALSVTGIAGPNSDNSKKPLGLVYIALQTADNKTIVKQYNFTGSRKKIQKLVCLEAYKLILANIR